MADPFAIVPYHDPSSDDILSPDQILMLDESPTLGMPEFPLIAGPTPCTPATPQLFDHDHGDDHNIMDADDPVLDPMIWHMLNEPGDDVAGDFKSGFGPGPGPSGVDRERNGHDNGNDSNPGSSSYGNSKQISVSAVPPSPYNCSCCQTLREIMHTDGRHYAKLEVHGRIGMINHAVLEKYDFDPSSHDHEYRIFDFCKESITSVKQFLIQYCQDRKQDGYYMLQDPLFIFYQALCVGLNSDDILNVDSLLQPSPLNSGDSQINPESFCQPEDEIKGVRLSKSSLAAQRERTGKLKLKDITGYFHLPIDDAAKKMNICPTVMKKICRRGGLSRWPYRKIRSIQRKISKRKESLNSHDQEERSCAQMEIRKLEQELSNIFSGSSVK